MQRLILTAQAFLLILLCGNSIAIAAASTFVGSKSCFECHAGQQQSWLGSDHDLAMQHANRETVVADFDNTEFSSNGIVSRFFIKDGRFWVNTDGADGRLQDFEISYTFGVRPLQQYLVEFPDGRLQALSIAWDSRTKAEGGQRWFHLYPHESINAGDVLHWTGGQQNWNYMCADCHSTQLRKNYDLANDQFNTTWSDINVGCEACHGPGQAHLEWANQDEDLRQKDSDMGLLILLRDRQNSYWIMDPISGIASRSQHDGAHAEVETCAACHSRRGQISTGVESDGSFLDHYRPALLTQPLYHNDGQILDEVYVWGSFTQSKMAQAGVSCSDCHDPHSLKLRAEQELVCAQCHLPSKFASTEHHKHPQDSTGANCLECHMPAKTYMVVDPRRDHSLRIPRPDLSIEFGTPNACNNCHTDKTTQWAAAEFVKLWPRVADPYQSWTRAFTLARSGAPQSEIALINIIRDTNKPPIARATAVSELRPYLSPLSGQVLQVTLSDPSPLVRFAALGVLDALPLENRYQFAAALLKDPVLLVRIEAARVSAPALRSQLPADERILLLAVLQEYIESQNENAERPESHMNLGNMYAQSGEIIEAEKAYRQAIKLDSKFGPAYTNLADLYRAQGMEQSAAKVLDDGISSLPDDASLYHAQGLLLARGQQLDAAIISLKKASDLAPDSARYAYVYAVALNSTGHSDEAMTVLEKGFEQSPRNQEIIFMMASIKRDIGQKEEALKWANKLLEINPADQNATQFIEMLKTGAQ